MNDIVVGTDQSKTARRAVERAASLAEAMGVNLHIVMGVKAGKSEQVGIGSDTFTVDPDTDAEAFLNGLVHELPNELITTHISHKPPAESMCEEAKRVGAGMIVVGNRRVQGVTRVLGSIATEVARQAPCDVLIANTTG